MLSYCLTPQIRVMIIKAKTKSINPFQSSSSVSEITRDLSKDNQTVQHIFTASISICMEVACLNVLLNQTGEAPHSILLAEGFMFQWCLLPWRLQRGRC